MKKVQAKPKLIKELEKTPIMTVACEKVGIARNTAYRWMKEDEKFLEQVKDAMQHGVGLVNDVAESNILKGIKQGDKGDTKYWLSHRHESFKKPFRHRDAHLDILAFKQIQEFLKDGHHMDPLILERKRIAKAKARAMLDGWKHLFPKEPMKKAKKKKK